MTRFMIRLDRRALCSLAAVAALTGCGSVSSIRKAEPSTVGRVASSNNRLEDGWFVVATPSTLRVDAASEIEPDPRIAIARYDRVAELDAPPEVRAEALRRSGDLRIELVEAGEAEPSELRRAIEAYQTLLADYPHARYADRALYQLARAYELTADDAAALAALRRLGREYPDSVRLADARFRAAEKLYLQRRFAEAETEYAAVVARGDELPYFERAQYQYGWALYKQGKFDEALPVFLAILDRELPQGEELDEAGPALAQVAPNKAEMVRDALRVAGLSFAALGGGEAVNDYLATQPREPRFTPMLYAALGRQLRDKQRYTDAAETYEAFIRRHPQHRLAPGFQALAIAANEAGGFGERVIAAKTRYVTDYAPDAAYWQGRIPPPEVIDTVQRQLDEIGTYHYANAQSAADEPVRRREYQQAAQWYERRLALFPQAEATDRTSLLLADALYAAGETERAAERYQATAATYADSPRAPEAAYAAIQAYQAIADRALGGQRAAALQRSVDASLALVERFPAHAGAARALTRASEDLFELKQYDPAIVVAARVLEADPPAAPALQQTAWGVTADAQFLQARYAEAEQAYTRLLAETPADAPQRAERLEQLAAAIYKQGEAAREAGELLAAARAFERVGTVTPNAGIRAAADYDAAAAYVALQDWPAATAALEGFRRRHPQHGMIADVDKQLAHAYQETGHAAAAGAAYARIAQRESESPQTRRDAAWLAAKLQDEAGAALAAERAYEDYLARYPRPLARALEARGRLADIAIEQTGNGTRYVRWLREIVATEAAGGAERNDETRLQAAKASLSLGRIDAANARAISLREPLASSLARRKTAVETAIASLSRASDYGFAQVTTAATYEIGKVYRELGTALMSSERPARLDALAREQYELLLEEQAYPFEEKAIAAYEANLGRLKQGLWDEWIQRSTRELAELVPAQYGKQELRDASYDSLF